MLRWSLEYPGCHTENPRRIFVSASLFLRGIRTSVIEISIREWLNSKRNGCYSDKYQSRLLVLGGHEQKVQMVQHPSMQEAAADDKIYLVMMGESEIHCYISLGWALRNVPRHKTLVLVHIFQPTVDIPMLSHVQHPYRRSDRKQISTSFELYVRICARKKVRAEKLIVENDDVVAALLDLIVQHQITTLILSSVIDRIYGPEGKILERLEKQADPACSILYLHNGNLIYGRQGHDNMSAIGTYDLPSSGSSPIRLSGSSSNTSDTLSSIFRDSCSTGSGFDVAQLDNLSLENNASMLHDARFSVVFDHESLSAFKGKTVSHLNVAGQSQELHHAFHARCVEMGIESVLRLNCKNFQEKQWMAIYRWPQVLLFTIMVLDAIQSKQNHNSEAAKEPIRLLLSLASKVAKVKKTPEKLFCVLDMHTALFCMTPILTRVFDADFVTIEVGGVVAALKDSARGMLLELKVFVQTNRPQHEPTQGSVLRITKFLMTYIKLLVNHTHSLDHILCQGQDDDLLNNEGVNMTGRLVSGIIADLESQVQESSSYVPQRLKFLFLMNNAHFVLQQVEESDVRLTVGAQWIKKRHESIKQYMGDYLSSSWKHVVHPLETATSSSRQKRLRNSFLKIFYPTPSPLESFESALNKACKSQMHWKVCSPVLRMELRTKVMEYVVQAYRTYWDSLEESVRGGLEDLEPNLKSKLSELFEG